MKAFVPSLVLLVIATTLVACGKNDKSGENSSGGTVATLPQPSQRCLDTFSTQAWSPYRQYGFFPYDTYTAYAEAGIHMQYGHSYQYQFGYPSQPYMSSPYPAWTPQRGFCGCPAGTVPVCDNSAGMACVSQGHLNNMPYRTWGFDPIQSNWNQSGWGQMYAQNSCYQSIAQSCQVGSLQCGPGALCMATVAGSPIGICVRH
ncbi:MAG: hypothetical protein NDI61_06860 [Bdellovibrionaceae bacterium]|nr:hypothetical protein [Pseudobdellovibrionaceae bacterium]